MAGLTAAAWLHPTPAVVAGVLLAYTVASATQWPVFESLVSDGAGPVLLSRRIGAYNLLWSFIGTAAVAATGTIISRFPAGMFLIPLGCHVSAVALLAAGAVEGPAAPPEGSSAAHPPADESLLRQRTLALVLSRTALPATYTVTYTLVALMPSLPVIRSFSPGLQTVVASGWMVSRFLAFVLLGATTWWHTRPRLLLAGTAVMLVAFLGVTLRPADVLGHAAAVSLSDQAMMIGWEIVLGLMMGLIYAGSLYFGMVLGDGGTEHGGYHEALIGLGQVIGPATGLAADRLRPGDTTAVIGPSRPCWGLRSSPRASCR